MRLDGRPERQATPDVEESNAAAAVTSGKQAAVGTERQDACIAHRDRASEQFGAAKGQVIARCQ